MKLTKTFAVIVALVMSLCILATSAFAGSGADGGGGVSAGAVSSAATQIKTPSVEYEKSADGKTFHIECINVDEYPVAIVLALYNGTKLAEVKISQGYSSEATFVTGCQYDKERIMVLKSLGTMCPVVKSENIIERKVDDFSDAVYVNIADIDSTEEGESYDSILYYASPTTVRVSRYKLAKDAKYIYNNEQIDGFASFDEIIKDGYGTVRVHDEVEIALVDKDGDERIDLVGVKEYTYDVVKSVDKESSLVEGMLENLKIENGNADISMKNAAGETITLDDFSKGDVIAYISSNSDPDSYDWIEIINLGQNSVTGMVDETDSGNRLVWVNSTEHGVTDIEMPRLGDEGVFYLTKTGKIFFFELIIEKNYAYVLDAGFVSANFTEVWQIKLLTQENEVFVYTVRGSIEFNGEYISCKREDCEYLETFIAKDANDGKDADKGGHRVITYELDSSDKVSAINTVDSASFANEEYYEENNVLGTSLLDSTVLFNVSSGYREDYFASDISSLEEGTEYTGYHITYMSSIVDCVVITHPDLSEENVPEEEPEEVTAYYAYVVDAAVNESSIAGLWQVKLLTEDDRLKIYTVKEKVKINGETMNGTDECSEFFESFSIQHGTGNGENLDKGAHRVIKYTLDANGEIRKIDTFGWTQFSDEQINISDLDENVIVFNVSSDDSYSWYTTGISSFEGSELYSGYYIINSEGDIACMVVTRGASGVYDQTIALVSSVSDLDIYDTAEDAKKVNYYLGSDKVCEYKIDTGSLVNYDNYESPSFNFLPVVSEYEIINITDAEVTPVETDGEYYPDVWKNKTDIPFIIVVPDIGTPYITNS